MPREYISYETVHTLTMGLVEEIRKGGRQPQAVLGLVRGGMLPAVLLSHHLNIPMVTANYSSPNGKGSKWYDVAELLQVRIPLPIGSRGPLLIVDDLVDTGRSMEDCYYFFGRHYDVLTAVLILKSGTHFDPHYYADEVDKDTWIVFPWEKD